MQVGGRLLQPATTTTFSGRTGSSISLSLPFYFQIASRESLVMVLARSVVPHASELCGGGGGGSSVESPSPNFIRSTPPAPAATHAAPPAPLARPLSLLLPPPSLPLRQMLCAMETRSDKFCSFVVKHACPHARTLMFTSGSALGQGIV